MTVKAINAITRPTHSQIRLRVDPYRLLLLTILGLWFLSSLATANYNGPFFDEAIYATAGLRTLEGYGVSDGYLGWMAGSLIWPVLAGIGYRLGGLLGSRAIAALLMGVALWSVASATRNLFGRRAALWTALTLGLSGPFVGLARLAVYDTLAVAGIAVSFWAVTQLAQRDDRSWLVVASLAFALGVLSKYPSVLMVVPFLSLVIALRGKRAGLDVGIFLMLVGAIGLAFYLPARGQLGGLLQWQIENRPAFGITPLMIAFNMAYLSLIPSALALAGWLSLRGQRKLGIILGLSLAIWPLYHLVSGNPVGSTKHVVLGYLFAYPLIGQALSSWARKPVLQAVAAPVVVASALVGLVQVDRLNQSWPDMRPVAADLSVRVEPGDRLLINEAWPLVLSLYSEGRITSPWDVYDSYRIADGQSPIGLCDFDWFVDAQGSYAWPDSLRSAVAECGTYRQVATTQSEVVGLGTNLTYVRYPVSTIVWQNVGRN